MKPDLHFEWGVLGLFVLTIYYCFRRYGTKKPKRRFRLFLNGAALGNALLQIQVFTQPRIQHVIEQKLDEEAQEDDLGDPDHRLDNARIHLHRQAARIRRGEQIDHITTILIPPKNG